MHESNAFDRVWALSKAAVAGVVRPPAGDPELQDPDAWPRQLQDQEARCETRFKSQAVKGSTVAQADDASYNALTIEVFDRAEQEKVPYNALTIEVFDRAEQEKADSYAHWPPLRKR